MIKKIIKWLSNNKEGIILSFIITWILIYLKWFNSYWEAFWLWLLWWIILIILTFIEEVIIKNITIIIFTLIALFLIDPEKSIQFKDLYLIIGALFAFWYWYKKYERDKELEILNTYSKRYNDIIENLKDYWSKIDSLIEEKAYSDLINLWYEEYFLHCNWYISDRLWNEWSYWIKEDIENFIDKWYLSKIWQCEFILYFGWKFIKYWFWTKKSNKIKNNKWEYFNIFIWNIAKKYCEKNSNYKWWDWEFTNLNTYHKWIITSLNNSVFNKYT